ncbi:MAG: superoxide dismutase family protein [Lachnospiraceae bacterium]|nr:superoxide dismutase family protein [Lachnospiraceae bacterium]
MNQMPERMAFYRMLERDMPQAVSQINGSSRVAPLQGFVRFFAVPQGGVLIETNLSGLPRGEGAPENRFYGFHIHEKGDCSENFTKTGDHYNPEGREHPMHAGDLIPLMSKDGNAWMVFYDGKLEIPQIVGRSVVVHSMPDDFTSQPSGNSGDKIGCGVIFAT